jgi:glycosyltransferase involved in cell wall biosynthesis
MLGAPDAVVVISKLAHRAYQEFVPMKKLAMIPNAIDFEAYAGSSEKKFDAESLRFVYIGRVAYDKGIEYAIKAMKFLKDRYAVTNFGFEIAGSGPDEKRLKRMVDSLGLGDIVKFVGPIFGAEKIAFWRRAHIFLFPTFHDEGLPYALLESLASGTPVITTRVGGIPDVVEENDNAVFINSQNAMELAGAIEDLMDNRDRLKMMSLNGKVRVQNEYSIRNLEREFKRLYENVG